MSKDLENKAQPLENTFELEKESLRSTHKLSFRSTVLLALGSLTGSGIYVLIGPLAAIAGPAIILSIAIDLIFAVLIACCYGECVSIHPESGGGFVFIKEAFGDKGLFIGWIIWLSNMAYAAICAISVGFFVADMFGILSDNFIIFISISSILFFTYINSRGAEGASKFQDPLVIALLATYVLGSIYIFMHPTGNAMVPFFPYGIISTFTASAILFDLYIGFEDITAISEEIQNPRKTIPRVLIVSLLIAAFFMILVVIALFVSLPLQTIESTEMPFIEAVRGNPTMYYIILVGAVLALLTSIGVALMASSRNLFALAKYDFIDRKWREVDQKHNVPINALLLSSIISILIVVSGQVVLIASISNISYIVSVIFVAATVYKFRKTRTYDSDSFKVPWFPYSIYLTIGLCFFLIAFIDPNSILIAFAWILMGLFIYLFFSSKKRIYGTIFLVLIFFFTISEPIIGISILIFGILYYLFSIADRHSIILTLAGLKFFATVVLGIFLNIIRNSSEIGFFEISPFLIICEVIVYLSFITSFFDMISLREIAIFLEKRFNRENIAMQFGESSIVLLDKKKSTFIFRINNILGLLLLISGTILLVLFVLFFLNIIHIGAIHLASTVIPYESVKFLVSMVAIVLGISLIFSGLICIRQNLEVKEINL